MKHGRVESASLFIGKVARRPGVGVETTRFYERQGLLTPPVRKDPGYRLYPEHARVFHKSLTRCTSARGEIHEHIVEVSGYANVVPHDAEL